MMPHTVLMLYSATEAWLRLSPDARTAVNDEVLRLLLGRYADRVRVRLFDSEAYIALCAAFALFETDNLEDFYFYIEALRDTVLHTVSYHGVKDLIVWVEDGFRAYEAARPGGA